MGGSNSRVGLFREPNSAVIPAQNGVSSGKRSFRVQSRRYDIDRKLHAEINVQPSSIAPTECHIVEFRGVTAVSILRSLNASELKRLRASHTRCHERAPNGHSATPHTAPASKQSSAAVPQTLSQATLLDLIEPVCKARCLRVLAEEHVLPPFPSASQGGLGQGGVYEALLGASQEHAASAQEHAPGAHAKDVNGNSTVSRAPSGRSSMYPFPSRVPGGSTGSSPASSVTGALPPAVTGGTMAGLTGTVGGAVAGARSHLGGGGLDSSHAPTLCPVDCEPGQGGSRPTGGVGGAVPGGDHGSAWIEDTARATEGAGATAALPLSLFLAGSLNLASCCPCEDQEGQGPGQGQQGQGQQGEGAGPIPACLDPCPALSLQDDTIAGACISRPDSWLDLLLWLEGIQAVLADASPPSPSPSMHQALVGMQGLLGVAKRCREVEIKASVVFPYINLFHLYASDVDQDDEESSAASPSLDAPFGYSLRPRASCAMSTGAAGHGSSSEATWATRMGWRLRLVDWLHNVCKHFELAPEVMLSSISRADYHMHAVGPGLSRTLTQLLYLTALLLEAEGAGARQEVLAGIKGVAPAYTAVDFQSMTGSLHAREAVCREGWAGGLGQAMKGAHPLQAAWALLDLMELPAAAKAKAREAAVEGAVLISRDFSLHRWSPSTLGTALAYLALRAVGAWAEEALPQALLCAAATGEHKGETEFLSPKSRLCLAWCQLVHTCLHVDGSGVEQAAVAILCTAEQGMAPSLTVVKAKATASTTSLLSNPHPGVSLASQAGISVQAAVTVLYGSSAASGEEEKAGVHGQVQGVGASRVSALRVQAPGTAPGSSFPAAACHTPLPCITYPVPIPAVPLTFASASLCLPGQPDAAGLAGYAMRLAADMAALRLHHAVGPSRDSSAPPFTYTDEEEGQGQGVKVQYAQVMRRNVSMGSLLDSSSQRNARAVLRDYFAQRMAQATMVQGTQGTQVQAAPAAAPPASSAAKASASEPLGRKRTAAALSQAALPVPASSSEGGAQPAGVQAEGAEGSNGRESEGGRSIRAKLAASAEAGQETAAGLERASSYFRLRHPDAATPANPGEGAPAPTAPAPASQDMNVEGQDLTAIHTARKHHVPLPAPVSSPLASALVHGFAGMGLGQGQGAAPVPSLTLGTSATTKGGKLPPPVPGVVIRSRAGTGTGTGTGGTPPATGKLPEGGRTRAGTGITGTSASAVRLTASSGTHSTA